MARLAPFVPKARLAAAHIVARPPVAAGVGHDRVVPFGAPLCARTQAACVDEGRGE